MIPARRGLSPAPDRIPEFGPRRPGQWGWLGPSVGLAGAGPEGRFLPRPEPAGVVKAAPWGRKWLRAVYFGFGLADGAGGCGPRGPAVRRLGCGAGWPRRRDWGGRPRAGTLWGAPPRGGARKGGAASRAGGERPRRGAHGGGGGVHRGGARGQEVGRTTEVGGARRGGMRTTVERGATAMIQNSEGPRLSAPAGGVRRKGSSAPGMLP